MFSPDILRVSDDLLALAKDLDGPAKRRAVEAGALAAKKAILDVARADTGGRLGLRNWARSTVNVRYDLFDDHALVRPTDQRGGAVWHVLEEGAGRHEVRPKKKRGRKKKGQRGGGVTTPDGVRRWAHASSPGRRTWSRGVDVAKPEVAKAMQQSTHETIASHLSG